MSFDKTSRFGITHLMCKTYISTYRPLLLQAVNKIWINGDLA
jgi:hypothetical protein